MFYDLQRLRLQTATRTYARPTGVVIELHEADVMVLERRAKELHLSERHALADITEHLWTIPFYDQVLSDKTRFRGIGPTMAGVILSSFDIAKEDTVSKMWAFAGLRPMPAQRCRACHSVVTGAYGSFLHQRTTPRQPKLGDKPEPALPKCPKSGQTLTTDDVYDSGQAQRPAKGEKLPYNAWLRMKLVGVLGPVMLQCGSPFRSFYDSYKTRKASAGWGRSDGHRHQAAIRYMIKMLLLDIWRDWRAFEGLPVRPSYHEEFQGGHSAEWHRERESLAAQGGTVEQQMDPEIAEELAIANGEG
jgi:hypothetical protein